MTEQTKQKKTGRQPTVYSVTLKDSGVEVTFKKVSRYIIDDLNKERAKGAPEPPIEDVPTADGKVTPIPNRDDPTYAKALAEYEAETARIIMDALVNIGVIVDTNDDDIKAAIAEKRDELRAAGVTPSTTDDRIFWVRYVACAGEDYADLATAISSRSGPSGEVIDATKSVI